MTNMCPYCDMTTGGHGPGCPNYKLWATYYYEPLQYYYEPYKQEAEKMPQICPKRKGGGQNGSAASNTQEQKT